MIEINNLTRFSVDKKFFLGVAKKVLKGENKGTEHLSIAFVSPEEMKRINRNYRKKNKPTDVLSFEKISKFEGECSEVVICPKFIEENLKSSTTTLKQELVKVLIHGILHTLGYDHEISTLEEERMFKKQDYYFAKISF